MSCLKIPPICVCESTKIISEINNEDKVIQFLMGLNESYGHVTDQILIMEHLPNINRAYTPWF